MKKREVRSLTKLADAAFEQASLKVIERAIQTGTTLILWENEAIVEVDPKEFLAKWKKKMKKRNNPSS